MKKLPKPAKTRKNYQEVVKIVKNRQKPPKLVKNRQNAPKNSQKLSTMVKRVGPPESGQALEYEELKKKGNFRKILKI